LHSIGRATIIMRHTPRILPEAMRAILFAVAAVAAAAAACGRADAPPDNASREHVTFSDSAGVHIAFNAAAALEQAAVWQVDSIPDLEIGGMFAPPELELQGIAGVRTTRSGIAVVTGRRLMLFDRAGTLMRTIVGTGDEPDDAFQMTTALATPSRDSLLVFDYATRLISVFAADGRVARADRVEGRPTTRLLSVFRDGTLLMIDEVFDVGPGAFEMAYTRFARHDAAGKLLQELPQQPFGLVGMLGEGDARFVTTPIHAPRPSHAGGADAYWVVTGRAHIARYSPAGMLEAVYRWEPGDLRIDEAEVEAWRREVLLSVPSIMRAAREPLLAAVPVSDEFPATRRAVADEWRRLWVELHPRPGQRGLSTWLVFAEDGAVVARVLLPPGFQPHEIGRDYLLGVEVTLVGIGSVRRYRLRS
jgi:hypothetical protein